MQMYGLTCGTILLANRAVAGVKLPDLFASKSTTYHAPACHTFLCVNLLDATPLLATLFYWQIY